MRDITLDELRTAIDDMYDQLDPDTIATWSVQGLDILVDGEVRRIRLEPVDQ